MLCSAGLGSQTGLLKHRLLGPTPGVSDLAGLEWGLQICSSNKFLVLLLLFRDHKLRPPIQTETMIFEYGDTPSIHIGLSPRSPCYGISLCINSS